MDNIHVWNAVLIDNTYHHVDCSWGALPINGRRISNGDIEDVEHFKGEIDQFEMVHRRPARFVTN
jgi:hypothetical protein